jgi:competence protein ComEA
VQIERVRRPLRLKIGLGAAVVLVLALAAVAVLVSAMSAQGSTAVAAPPRQRVVHTAVPEVAQSPSAFVHVVGQVTSPGVYEVAAGSRLIDAIVAAGGFTPTADQADLNLAQVVEDGQQIVVAVQGVPAVAAPGGAPGAGAGTGAGAAPGTTVDINTADAAALETLDGIGPSLAQRILTYRNAHGGFRSVKDLQNVTGIGPKKFAAIKAGVST